MTCVKQHCQTWQFPALHHLSCFFMTEAFCGQYIHQHNYYDYEVKFRSCNKMVAMHTVYGLQASTSILWQSILLINDAQQSKHAASQSIKIGFLESIRTCWVPQRLQAGFGVAGKQAAAVPGSGLPGTPCKPPACEIAPREMHVSPATGCGSERCCSGSQS